MNALVTIPEYSQTATALAELDARLKAVVYDVTTGKGMDAAKKDRKEVRDLRIALEAERVRIKAPALERSRLIDAEAKSLTARLVELESPIDAQIKVEEQKKERAKEAAEQAERDRIAAINARFDVIKGRPARGIGLTLEALDALVLEAQAEDVSTGLDAATAAAAVYENRMAISGLRNLRDARILADEAEVRAKAERAELDSLRAKVAEQERMEALRRDQEAAKTREVEQERQRAENAARAELEAAQAAERAEANRKLQEQAQKAADERAEAERARKQAEQAAEEAAIKNASLSEAATDALNLLVELGQGKHMAARKLRAALGLK